MNLYSFWILGTFLLMILNSPFQTNGDVRLPSPTTKIDTLPARFGFGRLATATEIARLDIDVRPDGKGLPAGHGQVAERPQPDAMATARRPADRRIVGGRAGGATPRRRVIG